MPDEQLWSDHDKWSLSRWKFIVSLPLFDSELQLEAEEASLSFINKQLEESRQVYVFYLKAFPSIPGSS